MPAQVMQPNLNQQGNQTSWQKKIIDFLHVYIGTWLSLVHLKRLLWEVGTWWVRVSVKPPPCTRVFSGLQNKLANLVHWPFYGILFFLSPVDQHLLKFGICCLLLYMGRGCWEFSGLFALIEEKNMNSLEVSLSTRCQTLLFLNCLHLGDTIPYKYLTRNS